jgi:hypothetical protein
MIPTLDLARVERWIDARNAEIPEQARDQIRYEIDLTDRAITVMECRPPWRPDVDSEWIRFPICRFRYTKIRSEWSLYWRDRNQKFHEYDLATPTPFLDQLIDHVTRDPTGIFWG